jgi:hypothetical protein
LTSFQGSWIHLTFTYDGSSNINGLKIYLNATRVDDVQLTSGTYVAMNNTVAPLKIGRSFNNRYLDGAMDEVAVFNTELSAADITDIYNSGQPTDLTSLSPVAWYRMGDNGSYKSPQWLIPENSNVANSRISNYSFSYDGVDDYVDFGNPTSLQITTDLSVSFWFKGSSTVDQAIVAKDTLSQRCWGIWNNVFGAGNNLQFYIFNSNLLTEVQTSANYNDGNWHNVVCIFKPSTYLRIYVDGVLDGENTTSIPATIDNNSANLTVGAILSSGSPIYEFDGNVDEVAIWNSDQSANVASIYNSGVPTTITGAVAHWKMGEEANFTDNWLVNNSALSNYSTRSFNFDGVDDYIDTGITTLTGIDFSISYWFKTTATLSNFNYYVPFSANTNYQFTGAYLYFLGTLTVASRNSTGTLVKGTVDLSDGNWHHIVVTYNASSYSLKMYVDGSIDYDETISSINVFNQPLRLGGKTSTQYLINCSIDEASYFNSELTSANVTTIYNSGEPADISSLSPTSWWRMGEDATFSTNWSLPDNVGSNTGTSANMTIADLEGNAPNYTGGGLSANMTIEDRVGDAPNSNNNALSFNMTESDRETDVPS